MTPVLKGRHVAVIGGGAFGLMTAVFAARRGAQVRLYSATPSHVSASAVAAGMLSPVFEALEAGSDRARFELLHAALRAWSRSGLPSPESVGALYVGEDAEALAHTLTEWGAPNALMTAKAAQALHPDLVLADQAALFTPLEARLTPLRWLHAMAAALQAAGGEIVPDRVAPSEFDRWRREWDAVVVAAGYASKDWRDVVPPLRELSPIKGHILHFRGGVSTGPTLRRGEDYIAPQPDGAVFGASMQDGCADLMLEPDIVANLHARAVALAPSLAGVPYTGRTGVRAATPDGLPLAGRLDEGLFTATGARRNGWLLAPLVAETVVATLVGEATAYTDLLDPLRFNRCGQMA